MTAGLLRRYQAFGLHWMVLFAAILIAWYFMYAMSVPAAGGSSSHHGMHHHGAADASVASLFAMWALMALAMMAPSLVPTLSTYSDVIEAGAGKRSDFYGLIAGYLAAWVLYALAATWLQIVLADRALIDDQGRSLSHGLNAALLLGAGLYQFSQLKDACLSRCRMPLTFFMERWTPGSWGAVSMGLRLGLVCVACCWALMLVGFIGGIMSLLWMGVATVLMTVEKLPQLGQYVTRPLGVIFLILSAWFTYQALI